MRVLHRPARHSDLAWLTYPGRVCSQFNIERTPSVRYGFAAGITLAAAGLAAALAAVSAALMLVVLLAAVLLSAWVGGWRPALVSTVFCAATLTTLILPRFPGNTWTSVGYLVQLGVFLIAAALLSAKLEQAQAAMLRYELEQERNQILSDEVKLLRENEQHARTEVETVRQRLTWLASSSSLLVASLDYRLVLQRLANIAVENLADWCVIDLLESEGEIRRVAAANSYPAAQALTERLLENSPSVDSDHPVARAIRTGKRESVEGDCEEAVGSMSVSESDRQVLRELGCASVAHVPMVARGRTLGVLTLVLSKPGSSFDSGSLELAQDLAYRAALGIDNARLYQAAQEEIKERARVEAMLSRHKAEIEDLNLRLQAAMTETHHRVKNNLQVIAAMVDLQLMRDEEMIPITEMARLGSHIRTLAGVHEILTHQTKTAGVAELVSAEEVLGKLLPMLRQTAGSHQVEFAVEDVLLPARQCTSLALVVNELVSNAIKHGRSRVNVEFSVSPEEAVLTVSDDGLGFRDGFDAVKSANTGLELVENLSRWDLGGCTKYLSRPGGGATVKVFIPISATQPAVTPAPAVQALYQTAEPAEV